MQKIFFISILFLVSGCVSDEQVVVQSNTSDKGGSIDAEVVQVGEEEDEEIEREQQEDSYPVHSVGEILDREIVGSDFTIGRVLSQNAIYTRYYITYVSDGLEISGIMNVPVSATAENPLPVLFLNHGYIDPVVYTNGRGLKREQDYFARNGYVVIHSDYRGHAQSDPNPVSDDQVGESGYTRDIIGGIDALKRLNLDYVDTENIGMLGHSMGGGVTMKLLVARPELVQAAVLYAPVSSDYKDNLMRWGMDRVSQDEIAKLQNTPGVWDEELIAPYSAKTFFDRVQAPVMIHHGDRDGDVPLQWSKDTLNRLRAVEKEVVYHEYTGEGHEFGVQWKQFMERSKDFFDQHLKKK